MIWFMVLQVVAAFVELVRLGGQPESEKDLEILPLPEGPTTADWRFMSASKTGQCDCQGARN
jgi:hypothetical protein